MKNYSYTEVAERCLTKYWGAGPSEDHDGDGWDEHSPAHFYALRWAKINEKEFKALKFKQIYRLYLKTLVQNDY